MKARLVRRIKRHGAVRVANAMRMEGWIFRRLQDSQIERMVGGLPRPTLERIVAALEKAK